MRVKSCAFQAGMNPRFAHHQGPPFAARFLFVCRIRHERVRSGTLGNAPPPYDNDLRYSRRFPFWRRSPHGGRFIATSPQAPILKGEFMHRVIATFIVSAFLMVGCGSHDADQANEPARHGVDEAKSDIAKSDDARQNDDNPYHSSVVAEVSGDHAEKIDAVGTLGSVTALASKTKTLLNIGATREDSEEKSVSASISVGLPAMTALAKGTTVDDGIGMLTYAPAGEKTDFSTMVNHLYYLPPNGGKDAATVTIDNVEKISTENHVERYRLTGHFSYGAASNPEPISEACMMEATKAAGRVPAYDPKLCGAQRVQVKGHFDSLLDVLEQ